MDCSLSVYVAHPLFANGREELSGSPDVLHQPTKLIGIARSFMTGLLLNMYENNA